MIRVLFTGGGTGGHIYPILAVAEELQGIAIKRQVDLGLYYFGAPGSFHNLLESEGVEVSKILSAKLRRYFDLRNFIDIPIFFPLSVIQSFWKVFWLMPDVLFSKGGPGSLPVVLACWFYRVPIMIHDSDSIVGLANRMAFTYANRIAFSFNSTVDSISEKIQKSAKLREKMAVVGNPVRQSLTHGNILESKEAKKFFDFNSDKPVILVIGGSQGSVKINNFMTEIAGELISPVRNRTQTQASAISNRVKDFSAQGARLPDGQGPASGWQVLHQTGIKNFDNVKKELDVILKNHSKEERASYKIVPYFEKDLKDAYCAADIVVSRASSGTIFENAAFGKPSILIPLASEVVGEHQIKNAYEYAKVGAAIVIEEDNLKPNIFMSQLRSLFSESDKLTQMSQAAKNFAKPEAAKVIAEEILKLGERG